MLGKQYGLILPNKNKLTLRNNLGTRALNPLQDSDEELEKDEEEESNSINWVEESLKKSAGNSGQKSLQKRLLKEALQEDATVFQYDEVYDDMKASQSVEKQKQLIQKKPKYIDTILKQTEKRKLENERRVERKVQKERDAEGDEFKDKESFVTPSYLKKLEELKKAEQEEKVQQIIEERNDVMKHKNMGIFYNHLYKQRLGDENKIKEEPKDIDSSQSNEKLNENVKNKSSKLKQRNYRKQNSESEDESNKGNQRITSSHIKTEPTSDENEDLSHTSRNKDYRETREKSYGKFKTSHSSRRSRSPANEKYNRRSRSRSRDRSRSYRHRNHSRSNSPEIKKEVDSKERSRHEKENSRSHSKKHTVERSRNERERCHSDRKRDSEDKRDDKHRSNRDMKMSKTKEQKENLGEESNSELKCKESINKTLGATNVNKMKLEDRIERFQKLFAKRTVGEKYDEAVQRYFARKADRDSKGLM